MTDYWIGPYGVRVSNTLTEVYDKDGINSIFKDGATTEMVYGPEMTEEEYKNKYAELGEDGYYYYSYIEDWGSWENVQDKYIACTSPSTSPTKTNEQNPKKGIHGKGNWA